MPIVKRSLYRKIFSAYASVMTLWAPLETIANTMHRRVCPLYTFTFDKADRPYLTGSAVPFESGRLTFLVTAAHCAFDSDRKLVPLFTVGDDQPFALRGRRFAWDYKRGKTPDVDVAVIELLDSDFQKLRSSYQFATPGDVAQTVVKTPGVHYLLAGYPAARNRVTPRNLPGLATHLITGEIRDVVGLARSDKYDEFHFALSFPAKDVPTVTGSPFRVPKPNGMSGGGVWRLDIDIPRQLASVPSLVGIGIEYHRTTKLFIATRIQASIPLVWDLYEQHFPPTSPSGAA